MATANRAAALALTLTFSVSCSSHDPGRDADRRDDSTVAGAAGGASGGVSGASGAGTAGAGTTGVSMGDSPSSVGASAGAAGGASNDAAVLETSDAGVGAAGGGTAMGGGAGMPSGGGAAGAGGGAAGAGAAPDNSARCAAIEAEYTSSFEPQLTCTPGVAGQCQDRIEAAPGCDCRVFIEPKDPFAIEHLTNVFIEWLDADCEDATCPSTCPTGTRGACGSNGACSEAP